MVDKILKAALEWAEQGVPVFPCGPNKAPLTEAGHKDASTDPTQVKFLFSDVPEGTMIGARMGKESGLFACDFDIYKPGAEDYMRSLIDRGLLNETQTHLTRSGGLHFIYRGSVQPNCKPAIGVEVKGEGGYIIVPPSEGYSIERRGIRDADDALIAELLSAQKASSGASISTLKRSVLSGKSFHDPLAQIAARRSAQGWAIERVQKELIDTLEASAASKASHPRHERWKGLIEDRGEELSRIVGSGDTKFNASAKTEKVRDNVSQDKAKDFAAASSSFFERPQEDTEADDEDGAEQEGDDIVKDWPFEDSGYSGDTSRDIANQRFIAYPLLAERETVLIAAEPKAGKTAIALTLAAKVAQGESIGDAIQITEQQPVLYFSLEGARAVELRLEAMRRYAIEQGTDEPDLSRLFVVDRPHNFLQPEAQQANCARIALHSAKCEQEWGTPLGLIVIDTLTKAMPAGDQNSVEDTSQLFELIGMLRNFGVDATIVFIHHLSKQGAVRGSTNIEAEVDVVLGVEKIKDSSDVWLNIRRARSIDDEAAYRWEFHSVSLGETVQGHPLAAPVVTLSEQKREVPTSGGTRDNLAWAKLCQALAALGEGKHDVNALVTALHEFVTLPKGKRVNYYAKSVQDPLQELFKGKHNWSYGDWYMKVARRLDEKIDGIELRFTG